MKNMKKRCEKSRRNFFKSLAAGSAVLLSTRSLGRSKAQAESAAGQPADIGGKGYRLTAHVKRYYEAARF